MRVGRVSENATAVLVELALGAGVKGPGALQRAGSGAKVGVGVGSADGTDLRVIASSFGGDGFVGIYDGGGGFGFLGSIGQRGSKAPCLRCRVRRWVS
jgi:hypothetical protein